MFDKTFTNLPSGRLSVAGKVQSFNGKFKDLASRMQGRFSTSTLQHALSSTSLGTMESLENAIVFDSTTRLLSYEAILFSIFRNLDTASLANATRVCRNWNYKIKRLNEIWQFQCIVHSVDLGPGIEHILEVDCNGDTSLWFHRIFATSKLLLTNWKLQRYSIRSFPVVEIRDCISWYSLGNDITKFSAEY